MEEEINKLSLEITKEMEQAESGTIHLARLVSIFFHTLVKEGMGRLEATALTAAWIQASLSGGKK